jgi:L-lactate dehydrogenase complex protein LldF
VLVHLRGRVVREHKSRWSGERLAMDTLARVFASQARFERAQRLARLGNGPLAKLPGPLSGWTTMRDLPAPPQQTFRDWWRGRASPGDG